MVSDWRICWVSGEESRVIRVAKLEALALLLGAGCLLFRGICCGVSAVEVTGKAGKSRCSVKFGFNVCLYICVISTGGLKTRAIVISKL